MAVERDRPGGRSPLPAAAAPQESLEPTTPLPPSTAGLHPEGSTLEVGAMVAGRFGIVRFIARGGMGAVYEAEDTTLRTRVALKTILPEFAADPNAMERFRREVLLARRITHFNVCRIFELYDTFDPRGDRLSFLTMELLHGETLAERLARTGPLATAELSVLLRQLADGLEAMHLQDVVHRDFKPANVFLVHRHDAAGHAPLRAVITDFGIARALHRVEKDGDTSMTARVGFIGTPAYMAPEQLTGGTISAATDIYALGIVLYEALTGHTPFGGQTPMEAALKRLQQAAGPPSVFLPTLDPRWDAAVLRCLEKEPSARFRSVRDLIRALDASAAKDPRSPVAVLGFRNLSARPDAGWISTALTELVGRELSLASDVLRPVPAEEVFRAQRALNLAAQDSLPRESLEKLRDAAGARWVVLGSYLCVGPGSASPLRVAIRVQDTESGRVVTNWTERSTVGELAGMATRAGAELRKTLIAASQTSG
jgi:eukaryotic-like serine/threonine-protein kinase